MAAYAACLWWLVAAAAAAEPGKIRLPAWVDPSESGAVEANVQPAGFRVAPKPTSNERAPREPAAFAEPPSRESEALRRVRQIEHAASDARTRRALTRVLERCAVLRPELAEHEDWELLARMERVASWAHDARGRQAAGAGDSRAAIVDFRKAVEANPRNVTALHDLAVALAERGDDQEALDRFSGVLAIDPGATAARRNRAALHLKLGAPEAAVADCDKLLLAESGFDDDAVGSEARRATLQLRGVALHAAGRLRESATDLNEALRLGPGDPAVLTARGHVFAEGRFYDQAIADYTAALESDAGHFEAYRALAWLLATCPDPALRDPKNAVEAAWRARRLLGHDDFLTLDASAAAHAAAGEFSQAVRLQQRALMTAGETSQADAVARLRLYQAGRPYIAR